MGAGIALIAFSACAPADKQPRNNRDTMTTRQKDSVLGQSVLPGAHAVTRAMTAADSLTLHNERIVGDSATVAP